MVQVPFPITVFYVSSGEPLALGYVTIYLTDDASYPSNYSYVYPYPGMYARFQICGGLPIVVDLDINGSMVEVPYVYPCDVLVPSDVEYMVTAYAANGGKVSGPNFVTV